jgi:hypothetical protein
VQRRFRVRDNKTNARERLLLGEFFFKVQKVLKLLLIVFACGRNAVPESGPHDEDVDETTADNGEEKEEAAAEPEEACVFLYRPKDREGAPFQVVCGPLRCPTRSTRGGRLRRGFCSTIISGFDEAVRSTTCSTRFLLFPSLGLFRTAASHVDEQGQTHV